MPQLSRFASDIREKDDLSGILVNLVWGNRFSFPQLYVVQKHDEPLEQVIRLP